jgi:hypothetical protein
VDVAARPSCGNLPLRSILRPARPAACILIAAWAAAGPAAAAGSGGDELPAARCAPETVPAPAELEAAGARIGEIVVCNEEIFDLANPAENGWLYRAADTLHRSTRRQVVEHELLFHSGEPFHAAQLAETERMLRAEPTFHAAAVVPLRYHDGVVDVGVTTRDNWSLKPSIGFKRSGGANKLHFEIQETNLLGLGKQLTVLEQSDVDRTSLLLDYTDPQILGTRLRGEVAYADNSDGETKLFSLERPFFSLDARWTAGVRYFDGSAAVSRYELGEVRDRFRRRDEQVEGWFGWSRNRTDTSVGRLRIGVRFDDSAFGADPDYPLAPIPADRRLVYPWVSWQWLEDRYVVEHDVDRIDRPEDLNLGWNTSARVGWSARSWGADRDALLFEASAARGWRASPRQLLFPSLTLQGRFDRGGSAPFVASLGLRYHVRDFGRQAFYAAAAFDFAHALESDQQLLLGGDTGLRGYPLRYQEGDRRFLLNLEQRWYGQREFFKVVRFGAAAFADLGRAWFAGQPAGPADRGWLSDAGIGLRVAPSRTSHANVIRLDLAFPLQRDPGIASVQYLVTTSTSF